MTDDRQARLAPPRVNTSPTHRGDLTTVESEFGPAETVSRIEQEVVARGMTIFAKFDHAALAAVASLSLRPTEVVVFGNPRAGTALMQVSQVIGIDLPLKALVWQDVLGKTWVSYNEPGWLGQRHKVEAEALFIAMGRAMREIVDQAAHHRAEPDR
jgi:uncharacterized protein (DUF302 family)